MYHCKNKNHSMLIDICFFVLLVFAIIKGYNKGFILALFSIIAFIIGLAAALKLSILVAGWISANGSVSAKWIPFVSFALVFLIVVILVNLAGRVIQKTVETILLGWVNRMGGIVLYLVLYAIVFSIVLFYAVQLHFIETSTTQSSVSYLFIRPWGPTIMNSIGNVIPFFKDMFGELESFFGKMAK